MAKAISIALIITLAAMFVYNTFERANTAPPQANLVIKKEKCREKEKGKPEAENEQAKISRLMAVLADEESEEAAILSAESQLLEIGDMPDNCIVALLKIINRSDLDDYYRDPPVVVACAINNTDCETQIESDNSSDVSDSDETEEEDAVEEKEPITASEVALNVLKNIGASAVNPLLEIMLDNSSKYRDEAVLALGVLGENASAAVPVLYDFFRATYCKSRNVDEPDPLWGVPILNLEDDETDSPPIEDPPSTDSIFKAMSRMGDSAIPYLLMSLDYEPLYYSHEFGCKEALARFGIKAVPGLIEILNRRDESRIFKALNILDDLGENASDAAIPLAVCLCEWNDEFYQVEHSAVDALQKMGKKAAPAFPYLLDVLKRKMGEGAEFREYWGILAVLEILGENAAEAAPVIMELAVNPECIEPDLWSQSAKTLSQMGPAAFPTILSGLSDENEFRNKTALGAIDMMEENAAAFLPDLMAFIGENSARVELLSRYGIFSGLGTASVPYLLEALKSDNPDVRQMARDSLVHFNNAGIVQDAIATFACDNDAHARRDALWASRGTDLGLDLRRKALYDPDSEVRLTAADMLLHNSDNSCMEKVKSVLMEGLNGNREEQVKALGAFAWCSPQEKDMDYLPHISSLLSSDDEYIRHIALNAINNYGWNASCVINKVYPLLLDDDEEVRDAAAQTLYKFDNLDDDALCTLVESFKYGSYRYENIIQANAAMRCAERQKEKIIPYLERALQSGDENMRVCAEKVLEEIKNEQGKK
jgi:HEAT repeat protein